MLIEETTRYLNLYSRRSRVEKQNKTPPTDNKSKRVKDSGTQLGRKLLIH